MLSACGRTCKCAHTCFFNTRSLSWLLSRHTHIQSRIRLFKALRFPLSNSFTFKTQRTTWPRRAVRRKKLKSPVPPMWSSSKVYPTLLCWQSASCFHSHAYIPVVYTDILASLDVYVNTCPPSVSRSVYVYIQRVCMHADHHHAGVWRSRRAFPLSKQTRSTKRTSKRYQDSLI
jgi:hypothetical protein